MTYVLQRRSDSVLVSSAVLITLVGPSGAGKTTLARALQAAGMGRIPTTTTRPARIDEVSGRDLHVVSIQRFNQLRSSNALIATCDYSSASYGVQLKHLHAAAATAVPQIIIVEPSGVSPLKSWAADADMRFAAIFVTLSAAAVRARLETRYAGEKGRDRERDDRLARALEEATQWRHAYEWDFIAETGDTRLDAEAILEVVARAAEPGETFAACA